MKKKSKLPLLLTFFLLFNLYLGIFSVPKDANAVIGSCMCSSSGRLEPTYGPRNCSECDSYCPLSSVLIGGSSFNLERSSCTEDGSGGVTCNCAKLITGAPEGSCLGGGGISCAFSPASGAGGACNFDDECHGTGCEWGCWCQNGAEDARASGFTDLDAYRVDVGVTAGACLPKRENGENCVRSGQCGSSFCGKPEGADEWAADICRPQPGPGEEVTPEPGEGGVFPTYNINSPIGEVTGPQLIGRIIKTVLTLVGALALLMFVFGGFTWLTSGGSADKIKKGKDILMWATIGLIVVFSSYTLVDFLLKSFGL